MPKRTLKRNPRKKARKVGFMARMQSKAGRKLLQRRRTKGRATLTS